MKTKKELQTGGVSTDQLIDIRDSDEFRNKAFWLNDSQHNWEIKKDRKGLLCLIPTKKNRL